MFLRDRVQGKTTLVSANNSATDAANGDSWPADLSTNGRYAVFESVATDLVPNDTNNVADIFVRDVLSNSTVLASVTTNGSSGNGASRSATITPDGHFVAFVSAASNLVAGDTNGIADVFVRDLQSGVTVLVSSNARNSNLGTTLTGSSSEAPQITPDGRYVAFYSTATNLVAGVTNSGEVYVRDLLNGVTARASAYAQTALYSVQHTSNSVSYGQAISADGKFIAYEASPSGSVGNLASGLILRYNMDSSTTDVVHTNAAVPMSTKDDARNLEITPDGRFIAFVANTNGTSGLTTCVGVWDALSGQISWASLSLSNSIPANSTCDWPALDATGQKVAFLSTATNLTTNVLVGSSHLYIRDLQTATITLVDADNNGTGQGVSSESMPRLSADGKFVAFETADSQLQSVDRNRHYDVFVRDLLTGALETISARAAGFPDFPHGTSGWGTPALSDNGRFVAFSSDADNLTVNDTNALRDVVVRDLLYSTNELVSIATNGFSGDDLSTDPVMSEDGRFVVFASRADNLATGDTNNAFDVFIRDRQAHATSLVSVRLGGGGPANGDSYVSGLSADGRYALFVSRAANLAPAAPFSGTNLFFRDLVLSTNYALTTNGVYSSSMTPDGHFVAFIVPSGVSSGNLFVWDSALKRRVYTNLTVGLGNVSISPDGNRLAYWSFSSDVFGTDRAANTNFMILDSLGGAPRAGFRFSADGRFFTYAANLSNTNQAFLFDFATRSNRTVTAGLIPGPLQFGMSDSPVISSDGRFVVFRSGGSAGGFSNTNAISVLYLYDRLADTNSLLTFTPSNHSVANNWSFIPTFSGDGHTLVFSSWASDLVGGDINPGGDLFAYFFLYAHLDSVNGVPAITWPATPGRSYQVQFKNGLNDPNWQDLNGAISITGYLASIQDNSPEALSRFYRIVAY